MKCRKKLIEFVLPLEAINAASPREKSILHACRSMFISGRHVTRGADRLGFIRMKGRATDVGTRNEILYSLNKPSNFILAIVEFLDGGDYKVHYVRKPFKREPGFAAASINYAFSELLDMATAPS